MYETKIKELKKEVRMKFQHSYNLTHEFATFNRHKSEIRKLNVN